MPRRPDPIVDLLLAADLPGIAARAKERHARAAGAGGDPTIAAAWKHALEACRELMPVDTNSHSTYIQPTLFPMSRVKSARRRRRS